MEWWQRLKHQWWDGGDGGEVSERTSLPFVDVFAVFAFATAEPSAAASCLDGVGGGVGWVWGGVEVTWDWGCVGWGWDEVG